MSNLEDLRKEATDLGITYGKTLGEAKLRDKIDAFYEARENAISPAEVVTEPDDQDVEEDTEQVEKQLTVREQTIVTRIARQNAARVVKIVTIIDNDQRVNNQTSTCTVNCSNEFFDLGTVVMPLNERIEAAMGHIRTLQQVQIPLHVRDTKTGLSTVRLRPRYTITFG